MKVMDMKEINKDCICFNISKASRKINQIYDKVFKPFGISAKQFNILAALASIEAKPMCKGVFLTALSNELGMDRTTCARNINILKKNGFVDIENPTAFDRRAIWIRLSRSGLKTFDKALPRWEEFNNRKASSLTGEVPDLLYLYEMLEELCEEAAITISKE